MYNAIPWPDKLGLNLVSYLPGPGEPRRVRRYIARQGELEGGETSFCHRKFMQLLCMHEPPTCPANTGKLSCGLAKSLPFLAI